MEGSVDKNVYRAPMRRLSDLRTKRTARATGCAALRRIPRVHNRPRVQRLRRRYAALKKDKPRVYGGKCA